MRNLAWEKLIFWLLGSLIITIALTTNIMGCIGQW